MLGLLAAAGSTATSATAQDAAETATIIAGTSAPQARGARNLGSAISGSMQRAAGTVRVRTSGRPAPRGRGQPQADTSRTLPAGVDALEGTDAASYTLGNGARISVSGRLNPAAGAVCTRNCLPENAAPESSSEEAGESATPPKGEG
ncbi:hypothetical protein [Altererythrobacter sp. Z27]|uniref:hypothetical protein n=1 Tax=Altererythrobacter sp. Z27 TaxID=3461147 RepID=UPI004043D0F8